MKQVVGNFGDQRVSQPAHLIHVGPAALFPFFRAALPDLQSDPYTGCDQEERNSGQDPELRVCLHFIAA